MHPFYLLSLLATAAAQTSSSSTNTFQMDMSTDPARKPISAAFMNITFSASASPICSHERNTSKALSIAIRTLPQTQVCFNMDSTFSDPSQTYTHKGTGRCDSTLGLCGLMYTVFSSGSRTDILQGGWDQVFYSQVRNPLNEEGGGDGVGSGGRLQFEAYSGKDCEPAGDEMSARWNCVDREGNCTNVGFGVVSFKVGLMDAEDVGMGSCAVAQAGGVGRRFGVGIGSVVLGLVGFLVVL